MVVEGKVGGLAPPAKKKGAPAPRQRKARLPDHDIAV